MFLYGEKAAFAGQMYDSLLQKAAIGNEEIDGMRLLQQLSGIMVETLMLFDEPDDGITVTYHKLAELLSCEPKSCLLGRSVLPPAYVMDVEVEQGRHLAKSLFEDIAPIASNSTDKDQSSSSPPPANITSCFPHWISSVALPIQCADVEQADEIE